MYLRCVTHVCGLIMQDRKADTLINVTFELLNQIRNDCFSEHCDGSPGRLIINSQQKFMFLKNS